MTVDFARLRASGWAPLDSAAHAESQGMSRLEAFKAVFDHWGPEPFAVDALARYGAGYPSRAAQAAATVGLAAIVLEYARVPLGEVAAFERVTGISRKVDALARAGRPDDALRFYDRLDARTLALAPITESDARHRVLLFRTAGSHLSSVVLDSVEPHPWGWVFSPRLTGAGPQADPATAGPTTRPLLVDRWSGAVIELVDDPVEDCVRRYETTAWPFPIGPTGHRTDPAGTGPDDRGGD